MGESSLLSVDVFMSSVRVVLVIAARTYSTRRVRRERDTERWRDGENRVGERVEVEEGTCTLGVFGKLGTDGEEGKKKKSKKKEKSSLAHLYVAADIPW